MIVNGVTLPDIPDEAKGYSHFLVYSAPILEDGGINYMLLGFSGECLVVKDTSPIDPEQPDVYPYWMYVPKPAAIYETIRDGVWVFDSEATGTGYQKISIPCMTVEMDGVVMECKIFWANHVVMEATLDDSGVPMSTGIQYYPKVEEEPKPTRVSIGRSLVDGYAKEVQRLTGTTDQMNANQIREKLSAVKTGIKIGDVVLPAIPQDVKEKFPYLIIEEVYNPNNGTSMYGLLGTKLETVFVSKEMAGTAADCTGSLYTTQLCLATMLLYMDDDWMLIGETDNDAPIIHVGGATNIELVWSNYDIYTATAYDSATQTPTAGTEVYFSERQNFNGVWLPKIPDGFFAEKPKGILFKLIYNGAVSYFLLSLPGEIFYCSAEVLASMGGGMPDFEGAILYDQPASIRTCKDSTMNTWLEGTEDEGFIPMGQYGDMYYYELLWSNTDVPEIAEFDPNTGAHTLKGIYFPPLPAIDTDRVSIGYDLCDGIVEEVRRLSGESEKMNALRAYWKLTTVVGTAAPSGGIVIDGVTLPEIPADVLASYPYCSILGVNGQYMLIGTQSKQVVGLGSGSGNGGYENDYIKSTEPGGYVMYGYGGELTAWTLQDQSESFGALELMTPIPFVWANHDLYTWVYSTSENEWIMDEIYFSSSV